MPDAKSNRANRLDGSTWLKKSFSIWRGMEKYQEERNLKHPAMFPASLTEQIIKCFAANETDIVLDPFAGSGSTKRVQQHAPIQDIRTNLSSARFMNISLFFAKGIER